MVTSSRARASACARRGNRVLATPLTLAAIVLVMFACGQMNADEIECEEAVEHLRQCCPGLDPRGYNCVVQDDGCGEELRPSLTLQTSQCVRSESCSTLVQSGTCARAIAGNYLPDDQRGESVNKVQSDFDRELCQ
jgi:hypothetical protein